MRARTLKTARHELTLDRTRLMGVLNMTPDSFSDGGRFVAVSDAVDHAASLVAAGATILDIGGESTRPGSDPVPLQVELDRVLPVVEALAGRLDVILSVDTWKAGVAQAALAAGAEMVNDVTALRGDPAMADVLGATAAPVVLMHALWPPRTMQDDPQYVDVVDDVSDFLLRQAGQALRRGIAPDRILVDPGIGFGKTLEHNLALLRSATRFLAGDFAVVYGPSRKGFLGELTGRAVGERLMGTAAVAALLAAQGVHI
ncbi:MAG: dihydropteroate synthase, partial [Deltaproteobacteria bacterium]|nr:dihydropteroate synthase [Deltaproteobacteria bacterium]